MTRETRSKTTQTEVGSSKDSMLSKTSSAARVAKAATSQATQKAPPATKRKRTTSAITTTAAVREEGSTAKKAKPTVPSAYTPTLLPPTLSFSLGDAKYHLSRHDPRFGHMFDNIPCKPYAPPIEAIDPFKTLVTSIIGQQVSWMAARAINKRFKELFGFTDDADGFPSPEQVASEDPLRLKSVGLSMRKTEYVISLSQHFIAGSLSTDLLRDGSDEDIAKGLIAVRGIGQWTVDMFLMFSLRRPDVLPVGDLGVQKGLLRWALAAHGVLPTPSKAKGKASEANRKKYGIGKKEEIAELDTTAISTTRAVTPTPSSQVNGAPPTPLTPGAAPHTATLHTPQDNINQGNIGLPPITPNSPTTRPAEHLVVPKDELPTSIPEPEVLLRPMTEHKDWNPHAAAPLEEGLSVDVLKARLSGKKAKGGAYLTPKEMEVLTDGWRPYRSLGVYYMWPAGEDF